MPGLFDGLLLDVRFAMRLYRRRLAIVAVSVVGLGLALGISTVVHGVVGALFLPRLGIPDSSTVVGLTIDYRTSYGARVRGPAGWAYADYVALRDGTRLVHLEAYRSVGTVLGDRDGEEIRVGLVSGGFFETLGVRAAIGRMLSEADDSASSPPAIVVNHNYWRRRMGADPSVVGRTVRLGGSPVTIVGVAAEGFNGPRGPSPPELWAPLSMLDTVSPSATSSFVWTIGRLAEGATPEQAEAELLVVAAGLQAERGDDDNRLLARTRLERVDDSELEPAVVWVMGAISVILGVVLLLACTNVANLLLAGAIGRRREIGVRLSLGASRARVVRQLLTESVLLSTLGGGLGLLCAYWALPVMARLLEFHATVDLTPDMRTFGFLGGITLLAGLSAGLAPARYGARRDLATPLKGDVAAGRAGGRGRTRSTLVALQAGASIVLLVVAALFTRAVVRLTQSDLRFDVDRLVIVTPDFSAGGYDAALAADYWERVVDRVEALPVVERTALALHAPLGGSYGSLALFQHEGRQRKVYFQEASADYFAAVGIPLLRGRGFTREEITRGAAVAVITEELAAQLWGNEEALGTTLGQLGTSWSATRVIGIVANAAALRLDLDGSVAYVPLAPDHAHRARLIVRTRDDPAQTSQPLLEAVRAADPELAPAATTARALVERELTAPRLLAVITGILGVIAVGLAVTGVFAMTAFGVEQRTGEIGIRMAIGAGSRDVVRLMLGDSLRPVAIGLSLGLLVAMAASSILTAALYGISPHDPLAILTSVVVLAAAAALAAIVPTRRAASVDPAEVLRRVAE